MTYHLRQYRDFGSSMRERDGTTAHFCAPVRDWLDIVYPGRWIGRQGPVLWSPRSPDLTALYFFLWGHLKELVFRDVMTKQMDLVARMHVACKGCFFRGIEF
ncbi:uncharacterized protein TNCV_3684291 [Trichonephila clavipes]|uniref:Uncharacterized protein n=1 Tax=Trichonephila clavipes TaxID=2585209 RepID=A0A8X6RMD7_TRICX|nr:uncharacterized protein TNCV_3684291 [Trichonephila clavipes]